MSRRFREGDGSLNLAHLPVFLKRFLGRPLTVILIAGANTIGLWFYLTHANLDVGTITAGITAVSLALLGAVKLITPALIDSIKTLGPALLELRKQREEILKGSLYSKIEALQTDLKAMSRRVEEANRESIDAREAARREAEYHKEEIARLHKTMGLMSDTLNANHVSLEMARDEIDSLRRENGFLLQNTARAVKKQGEEIGEMKASSDSVCHYPKGTVDQERKSEAKKPNL